MRGRFAIVASACALAACGGRYHRAGLRDGGADAGRTLTVVLTSPPLAGPDAGPVWVMIGDGTRFRAIVGDAGVAVFTDPALAGPQDITIAEARSGWAYVESHLSVTSDREVFQYARCPPEASYAVRGRAELGDAGVADAFGTAGSECAYAWDSTAPDGTFGTMVPGPQDAPVDVYAVDDAIHPTRIGLARTTLQNNGTSVDVPLDVPYSDTFTIDVCALPAGASVPHLSDLAFAGGVSPEARFPVSRRLSGLNDPLLPQALPYPPAAADLDERGALLIVSSGQSVPGAPVVNVYDYAAPGVRQVVLGFIDPPTFTSPSTTAAASNATFTWNDAPGATAVGFGIANGNLTWSVVAPPTARSFKLFALPTEILPTGYPPPGQYYMVEFAGGSAPCALNSPPSYTSNVVWNFTLQ